MGSDLGTHIDEVWRWVQDKMMRGRIFLALGYAGRISYSSRALGSSLSLRICWDGPKAKWRTVLCTSMYIATLFTMARIWKQLKCQRTDEWINEH